MNKYFAAIFCFLSFNCYSQSRCDCFDRLYNLSNVTTDELRSIEILKDAISFLEPNTAGEYYWEIASRYNYSKMYDSSAVWYQKAVEWGYDVENILRDAPEAYKRMDSTKTMQKYFAHRAKINYRLYEKFAAQIAMDQAIRTDVYYSSKEISDSSTPPCKTEFVKSMYQQMDKSTASFLESIFRTYGFPTFHKLGFFPPGINAMIMHVTAYRSESADKLLYILEEQSNKCEYQKYKVLFLKDRQKLYNDGKSYCGLIGAGDRYMDIENINNADSIRLSYNQVRLKEEAAVWQGKLPKEYKPLPYPKNYFCVKKYQIE